MAQERVHKRAQAQRAEAVEQDASTPGAEARERAAALDADTEARLADIDAALEGLDQDLAVRYVQRGGQ